MYKALIALIFISLFSVQSFANVGRNLHDSSMQTDSTINLSEHTDYFHEQLPYYKAWLKQEKINKVVQVDTIQPLYVSEDSIILRLKTMGLLNWDLLNDAVRESQNISLGQKLFDQFLFLFEIPPSQAFILIDGLDIGFRIFEKRNKIRTKSYKKQGGTGSETVFDFDYDPDGSLPFSLNPAIAISDAKSSINKIIRAYFKQFEVDSWYEHFEVEDLSRYDSELRLRLKNVVGYVISDERYWELINISFNFNRESSNLLMSYTINAKFSGGFESLWAPHDARYRPVSDLSSSKWDEFKIKFRNVVKLGLSEASMLIENPID